MSADPEGPALTFWDHLDELRTTLFHISITTVVAMVACYALSDSLRDLLLSPFVKAAATIGSGAGSLVLLRPTEGFVVQLKLALFAGLIVSSPLNFWHLWRFISPGLHENERRAALPFISVATLLFLTGVLFGFQILAYTTGFFLQFATAEVSNQWSLSAYIGFVTQMLLAFGIIFELPLVIWILARMGLVTQHTLRQYRRHAIVVILVISAILTPPDPVSQLVMAVPLWLLYELSVLVCVLVLREPRPQEPVSDGAQDDSLGKATGGDEEDGRESTNDAAASEDPSERTDTRGGTRG
ncbi:MAG: twin-arginine translocase subunit TatC [Candidatus Delongbacteria bacterium]|nr:twin-arginine translocase subunit TatC [Candidatus Delongbacteria bacterium]